MEKWRGVSSIVECRLIFQQFPGVSISLELHVPIVTFISTDVSLEVVREGVTRVFFVNKFIICHR